jgi:hypothetical protein
MTDIKDLNKEADKLLSLFKIIQKSLDFEFVPSSNLILRVLFLF